MTLSLKPEGGPPGDATAEQMDAIADLADRYSFGEIRVGHEQNLVLPHVAQRDLPALWRALDAIGVATPNVGLVSDIIACPGPRLLQPRQCALDPDRAGDHAALRAISISPRDLGRLHINISGCINACGHHHVGHIGILGVEKNGEEFYQITLGGKADEDAEARHADRARRCPTRKSPTSSRTSPRPISSCGSGRTNCSSTRSSASASSRFRERVYATR